MALSGRAWAVKSSKTPVELARVVAAAATGGGSGVVSSSHLRVSATPTPSGAVVVAPGIAVMQNRYPGSFGESYVERNDAAATVPITPTGSQSGRTDYLLLRVEDPQYPGQAAPADALNGPYTKFTTVTTDPRITPPPYPFALLGIITLPPNTATVTPAMIQSGAGVRELVAPRSKPYRVTYNGQATGDIKGNELKATTMDVWMSWQLGTVEVPPWATSATLELLLLNVLAQTHDLWGQVTVRLTDGSTYVDARYGHFDLATDPSDPQKGWARFTTGTGDTVTIPAALRGKTCKIEVRGFKQGGQIATTGVYCGAGASVIFGAHFYESITDEQQ